MSRFFTEKKRFFTEIVYDRKQVKISTEFGNGKVICKLYTQQSFYLCIKTKKDMLKQKFNTQWIMDLNIRVKTTEVLEENTGENFFNIAVFQIKVSEGLLDKTQKHKPLREKIN